MGYYSGSRYGGEQDRNFSERGRNHDYYRDARGYRSQRQDRYQPGYNPEDRGFFDRASDEVRSWFGDDEAERRRERDEYYNRTYGDPRDPSSRAGFYEGNRNHGYAPYTSTQSGHAPEVHRRQGNWTERDHSHDNDYQAWRNERLEELDRDYHEYRTENRNRFNQEFGSWRERRNTQRSSLNNVQEHAEVVGSDGEHVGKVDKVAGDRIILTKNDKDAGGHHHFIPSRWIDRIEEGRIILEKTAAQAHQEWRDAERNQALFGNDRSNANGPHYLDRAFSGTYRNEF